MKESATTSLATRTRWDILLFYVFVAISPLTLRKIITYFKIDSSFNEYTGVYIYLSDIVLILIFIIYILYNINYILSTIKDSFFTTKKNLSEKKLFHVEQFHKKESVKNIVHIVPRGTIRLFQKTYTHIINNFIVIFPLFMALFSLFSIKWTTNGTIAIFRFLKLIEFIALYYFIINIVPRGTISNNKSHSGTQKNSFLKMFHVEHLKRKLSNTKTFNEISETICSTWNKSNIVPRGTFLTNTLLIMSVSGTIQSIIGVSQFILQHSIGLFWLKESIISQSMPGVAKIIFNNQPLIRAYGLFPHPNIFGGYLAFSIIATLSILKLSDKKLNCSTWNNFKKSICIYHAFLFIQIFSLLLTFSKSAIIGLLISLLYIHKTNIQKMFHVEHFKRKVVLTLGIMVSFWLVLDFDNNSMFIKSFKERVFYLNVSRGTFLEHPLLGVGAGQFIFEVANIPGIEGWQVQPAHNVILLILNEYGIFITIGFIFFLWKIFNYNNCSTWNNYNKEIDANNDQKIKRYIEGIFLALIFIMMFDHYLWDIQQGEILFWLTIAFLVRNKSE